MECKETGQFAHRETTQYEQLETFNAEVVAETKGAEEYVHLKSLEDEYHYMESTMPNKEGQDGGQEAQPPQGGGEAEGEAMYGDPVGEGHPLGETEDVSQEEVAAAQAAMEAEYAEAYHLYHQKQKEQRERGEVAGDDEDPLGKAMFSMSPRPPPPFSEDTNQAQGFSSGVGRRGDGRDEDRARDAFAFAEELDQEEGGEEVDEAEQSQLFGDKIASPPAPQSRQGSGIRDKSYLFEPSSVENTVVPATDVATAAQSDPYLSRTNSYESLHEID